jgi:hypothetical protein
MKTILGTHLSGLPSLPGSVYIVTWHRGLTQSKVKYSRTDNWFPADDKMLERSNAYTTYSVYEYVGVFPHKFYLFVTYSYR